MAVSWKNLLDEFRHPVNLTNEANSIIYVNPAFEREYGYKARHVIGLPPHFLLPQDFPLRLSKKRFGQISQQSAPWAGVQPNVNAAGRRFSVYLVAMPLLPVAGQSPVGFLYVCARVEFSQEMMVDLVSVLVRCVVEVHSDGEALRDMIKGVRRGDRTRTIMRFIGMGYSPKQVAGMMGIAVSTVNTVKWRARHRGSNGNSQQRLTLPPRVLGGLAGG